MSRIRWLRDYWHVYLTWMICIACIAVALTLLIPPFGWIGGLVLVIVAMVQPFLYGLWEYHHYH